MPFTPQIIECKVEYEGESFAFYVKQASMREMLRIGQRSKENPARTGEDSLEALVRDFIVHADGSKLSEAEVNEIVEFLPEPANMITETIHEVIGLKRLQERAAEAKAGTAPKNS